MFGRFLALLVVVWFSIAGVAHAIPLLIGAPPQPFENDEGIIPFGGLTPGLAAEISNGSPTPRYQQVYDASSFGSISLLIHSITFFESVEQPSSDAPLGNPACSGGSTLTPPCGTVTLRVGTTSLPVNGLDADEGDLDNNFDQGSPVLYIQDVLVDDFSALGELTFPGDSAFLYDPNLGNLLIDVQFGNFEIVDDLEPPSTNARLYQATGDFGSPVYSVVDNYDGIDNLGIGLVTEFDITAIPEPATSLLLAGGIVGLVLARRRQAARP